MNQLNFICYERWKLTYLKGKVNGAGKGDINKGRECRMG